MVLFWFGFQLGSAILLAHLHCFFNLLTLSPKEESQEPSQPLPQPRNGPVAPIWRWCLILISSQFPPIFFPVIWYFHRYNVSFLCLSVCVVLRHHQMLKMRVEMLLDVVPERHTYQLWLPGLPLLAKLASLDMKRKQRELVCSRLDYLKAPRLPQQGLAWVFWKGPSSKGSQLYGLHGVPLRRACHSVVLAKKQPWKITHGSCHIPLKFYS